LNIQSIYRKLGTFPKKEEVEAKIQELKNMDMETQESITQL